MWSRTENPGWAGRTCSVKGEAEPESRVEIASFSSFESADARFEHWGIATFGLVCEKAIGGELYTKDTRAGWVAATR